MHFQTVDIVSSKNYSSVLKGTVNAASDPARLKESFSASPILNNQYDPKLVFFELVLDSEVKDSVGDSASIGKGHWGLSADYKRDYFIDGASSDHSAPNLLEVAPSANGGPGSPFTPNGVSSNSDGMSIGTGQQEVANPAENKTSRAPFVGKDADSEDAQPSSTSEIHRSTTLDMFSQDIPAGVMGSNTGPAPKPIS